MGTPIYLDHAAATPLASAVQVGMEPYLANQFYNPSATYLAARKVREDLQTARAQVAHWLGAQSSEIIFTAGGSEANNLAIHGIMRQYSNANIVVSAIEHESVLRPAERHAYKLAKVQADGRVDLDSLAAQIDDHTVLVSIMYANNEIGTVQPLRKVAQLIAQKRRERKSDLPLYLHTDACQAAQYLDLHVARLGVDLMTINGGKIYGPKQSGALYINASIKLLPLIDGGGQERGLRSGTENVPAAIGLGIALDSAQNMRTTESERLKSLQNNLIAQLGTELPNSTVNGSIRWRLPNNVHITLPGKDNERMLVQLEQQGILAAAGSACSASNEEPSHVLRALGVSTVDAQSSLRFTMGRSTTASHIDQLVSALRNL